MKLSVKNKDGYPPLPHSADELSLTEEHFSHIPYDLITEFEAFVFSKDGGEIKIAAVNPEHPSLQQYIKRHVKLSPTWFSTTKETVAEILKKHSPDFQTQVEKLFTTSVMSDSENVARLVDLIINSALVKEASDIHVEPHRNETSIRFRIDGILHEVATFPRAMHKAVVARFKILANLKIDEYRRPQDGRIEIDGQDDTSLRLCTIPTLFGEKIALRILRDSIDRLSVEHLGFTKKQKALLRENAEKPFGMIIASGPTGSGKTTTLYALLHLLKKSDLNISTLEDPIEYALAGVNQVQINPQFDLTFASGLRALLRQDPDVIMVGEIRDRETAVMAASAAMTGHLVFTTIHTNDSPSALTRLLEMGVEDFAIASTVNLIIGQRLVRQVCSSCATETAPSDTILEKITERQDILAALKKLGIQNVQELQEKTLMSGTGCKACFNTGYAGRVGLFEFLDVSAKMRDLVLANASASKIRAVAEEEQDFRSFVEDGLQKVFDGATTLEEILRVTKNA